MAPVTITAPRPVYAAALAAALDATTVTAGPDGPSRLRVGPDVAPAQVGALLQRLAPMAVEAVADASVTGLVLDVGSVARVTGGVRVVAPPAWRTRSLLAGLHIERDPAERGPGEPCSFLEAASGAARGTPAAHLLAAVVGMPDWAAGQDAQGLRLTAGATGCAALTPPLKLNLHGYASSETTHRRLHAALRREGWALELLPGDGGPPRRVAVRLPADLLEIPGRGLLRSLAAHVIGVEPSSLEPHPDVSVDVYLPRVQEATKTPTLRRVVIRTDDPQGAEPHAAALRALGIPTVDVTTGLAFEGGFRVQYHPQFSGSGLLRDLQRVVSQARAEADVHGQHALNAYKIEAAPLQDTAEIDLPMRAAREGQLLRNLLAGIGGYHVHVAGAARPREFVAGVERALRAGGPRVRVSELGTSRGDPRITVGAAPLEVGQHVARLVEELCGVQLDVRRSFSPTDDDIWIVLPAGTRLRSSAPIAAARVLRRDARPFVELSERAVRVGERVLERRSAPHPFAPSLARFAHTCIDAPTAALLDHLATSVRLREPVLLEGPTAAGKTSTVLLLAALLGQPVVRLNLSGQTDTGELIGRYAPREGGWAWQDGVLPRAMREGWWVLLDELNLAEPAVAERLNPALERDASLVLTEGDGARFGPGGVPVAPGFLVIATMNPADGAYGGRNALSPALRDRFVAQRSCALPGEREHLALLRQHVHGDPPHVTVRGVEWAGTVLPVAGERGNDALRATAGIDTLLRALAQFHASVDAASRAEDDAQRLGAARREGYTVSRRALLAALDFLADGLGAGVPLPETVEEAVARYYLARSASPEDEAALLALARAAGLYPGGSDEATVEPEREAG
jgi:MoxR-like ATPase